MQGLVFEPQESAPYALIPPYSALFADESLVISSARLKVLRRPSGFVVMGGKWHCVGGLTQCGTEVTGLGGGGAAPQRRRRRRQDAAPGLSGYQPATRKVGGKAAWRLGAARRKRELAAQGQTALAAPAWGAAAGGACAAPLPGEKETSAVSRPGCDRKTEGEEGKGEGGSGRGRRGSRGDEEVRRRWQVPGLRRPGVSGSGRGPSKAPSSPAWANWEAVGCAPATLACVVENLESPTASELILGRLEAPRSFRERAGRCRDALLGRVQGGKRARPVGSCPRLCTCLLTWRTVAVESLRPGEGRGGAVAAHYLCPGSPEGSRSCQIKPPDPRENPEASLSFADGASLKGKFKVQLDTAALEWELVAVVMKEPRQLCL
ncbi:uncharacterized protein [Symphalangus syndactylus]|uniref:uncharacterized protein n=1 Tax=Symphalangus syndactylus TaxID=9590 RepID=UPI0030075447